MKIELTDDYILQLATAYAIHAIFVCSEYESVYYKEYSICLLPNATDVGKKKK